MQSIDVIKNINKNKNDISNINYELSKTENTKYTTANGIKEFSCKDGYVDNVVIEGETLVNLASTVSRGADRLRVSTLYTPNSNTITFINLSKNKCVLSLNKESGWSRDIHLSEGKIAITLNQEFLTVVHARFSDGWTSDDVDTVKKSIVILEGDHTDKPISYFEGLKSVGQGDKIEVLARESGKSNLLKTQTITYKDNYMLNYSNGLESASNNHKYTETYIEIEPNTDYCFYHVSRNICWYDTNKTLINSPLNERTFGVDKDLFYSAKSPNNAKYLRVTIIKNIHNNGETSEIYKGEYDKKQIPTTLRSLPNGVKDTIEKRGNKYYNIKRCGEKTYVGSESGWELVVSSAPASTHKRFSIPLPDAKPLSLCVIDRYKYGTGATLAEVKAYITSSPNFSITELATVYGDLPTFKTGLANNPVTVVYELETPQIIELPNFNPQTFEGDTTLLINSGVIQGEAEFEVTNSMGSEIEVLKDKVSNNDSSLLLKSDKGHYHSVDENMTILYRGSLNAVSGDIPLTDSVLNYKSLIFNFGTVNGGRNTSAVIYPFNFGDRHSLDGKIREGDEMYITLFGGTTPYRYYFRPSNTPNNLYFEIRNINNAVVSSNPDANLFVIRSVVGVK